jgi:hypothetical protein
MTIYSAENFDMDELNTNSTSSLFLTLFLVDSGIE